MSGNWIKMRCDLRDHPKVVRMAAILGKDELFVVGALLAFWGWADAHSVDGRVDGVDGLVVDRVTRVDGLSQALCLIKWLSVDAKGVSIPRFEDHNSESSKERLLKNQRQARWRERKALGIVVDASTPSTNPSTIEEKRREEKSLRSRAISPPSGGKVEIPVNGHNGHDLLGERSIGKTPEAERRKNVPFKQIVACYHCILPELPKVEKLTDKRRGYIRQRWIEDLKTLDHWENFFTFVRGSPFLMGKCQGSNGRAPFRADIEWLTNPTNFTKIAEEKYHQ